MAATSGPQLKFQDIETVAALDTALAAAKTAGQPVMLDFTAEWCISCKEMEEYTFPDQGVIGALQPFMLLQGLFQSTSIYPRWSVFSCND